MLALNLFTDSNSNTGSSTVTYGGAYHYGTDLGQSLSDANIKNIVLDTADGIKLPKSTNAVYFVLTSAEIAVHSGFCSGYCGWHNFISLDNLVYAFVGNPTKCLNGCAAQSVSPNGDAGVDGMANVIMHELIEAITDPLLNGWYNDGDGENGDECSWTWGPYNVSSNGAAWNMKIGERYFLIQQTLLNGKKTASCAQSYYTCPAGYYNNLKPSQGPQSCVACPVNTYNPTPGKAESSSCLRKYHKECNLD
uniref:Uncharacterized protein n=1 Tax=Arcella intermedia TaxID=1963864 RepID=A0A6B2LBJ9_9EUKA